MSVGRADTTRWVLLAGAALLAAGQARAQLLQTIPPGPPNPVPSPPSPFTATPSVGGLPPASPGTITVRLNARLLVYAAAGSDSSRSGNPVTQVAGPTAGGTVGVGSPQSNTKLAPYTMFEYARIFPGFDGVAANGLKYGATLEIRQENAAPPGGGMNGGISASSRSRGALHYRRETAYVGTDNLGFIRYGATDGPLSLFMVGTFENFDDGGWNGDNFLFPFTTTPDWPFATTGNLTAVSKAVYLSPKFWDVLDFGVSFEPNTGAVSAGPGNCPYGVTATAGVSGTNVVGNAFGCDAASSTSSGDYARRRNTAEGVARLRTAVGPVGINFTVGGAVSGKVLDNATPARAVQFNGLNVFDAGLGVVYEGLVVGGHVMSGAFNGGWGLQPQGTRPGLGWIVGASYSFGSFIVGTHYFQYLSAGARTAVTPATVSNRRESGIAVGGTYTFAPGASLFLSYVYGQRYQGGFDFLSGAVSSATSTVLTNNKVKAQGVQIGTFFRW